MKVSVPRTDEEFWKLKSSCPGARVFAGGTDLLAAMRHGSINPELLISMERLESFKRIEDRGREIFIGACATHTAIADSPLIREHAGVLVQAILDLGSPQIRNMGTIGGNIVTASPAGDTLPPLYVLKSRVELHTASSRRSMPIDEFIQGPGAVALLPDEAVGGVVIPKEQPWDVIHFEKAGKRKALSIAIASMAALIRLSEAGEISEARLAWGSVGPTIVVSSPINENLLGKTLSLQTLREAAEAAREAVSPISDVRAGKEYRRMLAGNLVLRLLRYAHENGSF